MAKSPISILKNTFGYDSFRGFQEQIIDNVLNQKNSFVLMPTGSGKSLCYQIPALILDGLTIVVSPLVALMHDQVSALEVLKVRARTINSSISYSEIDQIKQEVRDGEIDLLYVSPERLVMPEFFELLSNVKIALFAIDEAHCISQWGHDFRPVYAQLAILSEIFPDVPRIALTATADGPTRKDILEKLDLKDAQQFISSFDRPNINYAISSDGNPKKLALEFIKENYSGQSGIVYCLSRKKTEDLTEWLKNEGLNTYTYHAGMDSSLKRKNQKKFLEQEDAIMVATVAFGMGIDKPDVRFVIHMNIPKNIESYYQETGRAGRDGLPAKALMFYGMADVAMQRNFVENSNAPDHQKRIERHKLNSLLGLCEAASCRRQVLLQYFGDNCSACGNCDICLNKPETFDGTILAQKALSCVYRTNQMFGVVYLIDILMGATNERISQFNHDHLSVYGVGSDLSKQEWQNVFRQLVARNLIMVDMMNHGGIKLTADGATFLKKKETIELRKYQKSTKNIKKFEKEKYQAIVLETKSENELFNVLKAKRLELAKENNLPPYVIFHDKALIQMVQLRPKSLQEMMKINGVGEAKLENYGQVFLELVN
ncbi:MAG: ATP-dependent DNA helicase RecQ [Rickettsiales bacterium]|jgi:ATP-dependent DNA helicase RecQ